MAVAEAVSGLMDKYVDQITLGKLSYEPIEGAKTDAVSLWLKIPKEALAEYDRLTGSDAFVKSSDLERFWHETGLLAKLGETDKTPESTTEGICWADALEFLQGNVWVSPYLADQSTIELNVMEVPQFYPDEGEESSKGES